MSPPRGDGPRVGYDAYVGSVAWRLSAARLEELRLSGHRCRVCNRGASEVRLEVHHRTYDRLGAERVEDLTTLCGGCHAVCTGEIRRRRHACAALPPLGDTPRVLPGRDLETGGDRGAPCRAT